MKPLYRLEMERLRTKWWWRVRCIRNGKIVDTCHHGGGYVHKKHCVDMGKKLHANNPHFKLEFRDRDKKLPVMTELPTGWVRTDMTTFSSFYTLPVVYVVEKGKVVETI